MGSSYLEYYDLIYFCFIYTYETYQKQLRNIKMKIFVVKNVLS